MGFEEITSKIESYREHLKQKTTLIEVIDYGAGKPEEKRTKEQMEAGVCVEVPLCELAKIGVKREKAEVIFEIFKSLLPQKILELDSLALIWLHSRQMLKFGALREAQMSHKLLKKIISILL